MVLNSRGMAFAAKTTAAAIAAILAALWLDLPNPGWAGLTVFLISQPLGGAAGAVVARATFRAIGTLVGASSILLFIPAFAGHPEWLIPGIAAWVGLCLYLSLLQRGPHAYAFMLAGYTLPLVGMSLANSPASTFNFALWRVEEIVLGAAFSILVHTLFAPRSLKPLLIAKARAMVGDAKGWILLGLGPEPQSETEQRARQRLAADLAEMRNLVAHLRFEPGVGPRDIAAAMALEERVVLLLPLLTGVEDRLAAMPADEGPALEPLRQHLEKVRSHVAEPTTRADALRLGYEGLALAEISQEPLLIGAMQRLAELLRAWQDSQALLWELENGTAGDARANQLIAEAQKRPLHIDKGLAAYSGLAAAIIVAVAAGVCWVLGWDQGAMGVGIAAAGGSLFASFDDPRPFIKVMLRWTVIAVPVAAFYVFAVYPAIDGFGELALALAPLFFVTALYLATPDRWLPALGFALISQSLISIQSVQGGGNFTGFMDVAIAAVMGTIVALVVVSLMRVIRVETSVRRLLRAAWRDLADLAELPKVAGPNIRSVWASRMLDRVALLLPRTAGVSDTLRHRATNALDDLRLGVNIIELRDVGRSAEPSMRSAIESTLKGMARHFRHRMVRPEAAPEPETLEALDRLIWQLSESRRGALRVQGLTAATGLRLGLSGATP